MRKKDVMYISIIYMKSALLLYTKVFFIFIINNSTSNDVDRSIIICEIIKETKILVVLLYISKVTHTLYYSKTLISC